MEHGAQEWILQVRAVIFNCFQVPCFQQKHLRKFEAYKNLERKLEVLNQVSPPFQPNLLPKVSFCTVKRPPPLSLDATPVVAIGKSEGFSTTIHNQKDVQAAIPVGIRHFQLALLQLERRWNDSPVESWSTYPLPPRHVTPPRNKTMILQWQTKKTREEKTRGTKATVCLRDRWILTKANSFGWMSQYTSPLWWQTFSVLVFLFEWK